MVASPPAVMVCVPLVIVPDASKYRIMTIPDPPAPLSSDAVADPPPPPPSPFVPALPGPPDVFPPFPPPPAPPAPTAELLFVPPPPHPA